MNLLEFVHKHYRKKIDFDGHYGAQCVDVFRQYCKEVLNIPHTGGVVGAKDIYEKYDQMPKEKQYFHKIAINSEVPKPGDVVIFGATNKNPYGHVGIVITANKSVLVIFEQDGFKQDGTHIVPYKYNRVLGFLRKR